MTFNFSPYLLHTDTEGKRWKQCPGVEVREHPVTRASRANTLSTGPPVDSQLAFLPCKDMAVTLVPGVALLTHVLKCSAPKGFVNYPFITTQPFPKAFRQPRKQHIVRSNSTTFTSRQGWMHLKCSLASPPIWLRQKIHIVLTFIMEIQNHQIPSDISILQAVQGLLLQPRPWGPSTPWQAVGSHMAASKGGGGLKDLSTECSPFHIISQAK